VLSDAVITSLPSRTRELEQNFYLLPCSLLAGPARRQHGVSLDFRNGPVTLLEWASVRSLWRATYAEPSLVRGQHMIVHPRGTSNSTSNPRSGFRSFRAIQATIALAKRPCDLQGPELSFTLGATARHLNLSVLSFCWESNAWTTVEVRESFVLAPVIFYSCPVRLTGYL